MENIESITEEKVAKQPFYSYRGITKCYSAGVSFVTDNALFILKCFGPVFACVAFFFTAWIDLMYTFQPFYFAISMVSLFLMVVSAYVLSAMVFRVFEQISLDKGFLGYNTWTLLKASRKKIVKVIHFLLIYIAVEIVAMIPTIITAVVIFSSIDKETNAEALTYRIIIVYGVMLLNILVYAFVVGVPSYLALYYVVMEKGSSIKNAWKGLKEGYRIWGKCFGLELLLGLTFYLIGFVFGMLVSVMYAAKMAATLSSSMGDPIDMPVVMDWILPFVTFVSIFFLCFLEVMGISAGAYLYASVKADEKNKETAMSFVEDVK